MNTEAEKIDNLISFVISETADFRISKEPSQEILRVLNEVSEKLNLSIVIVPKGTSCQKCGCDSYTKTIRHKKICQRCSETWQDAL